MTGPRAYDFTRAVLDRLYEMRDERKVTDSDGAETFADNALLLPEWDYTADGARRTLVPMSIPAEGATIDLREFVIHGPGDIIGADNAHPTWVSYEPMDMIFDDSLAGGGWSATGSAMIRLCAMSGADAAEALQYVAGLIWEEFRTGKSVPVPRLDGVTPARRAHMAFISDPMIGSPLIDDQNKIIVSIEIDWFVRSA